MGQRPRPRPPSSLLPYSGNVKLTARLSVLAVRKTSTPIVLDDVESAALKHRINLNNYNAGNKMTLERGSEKPMAGVITSENLKSEEQLPEEDDEGRKMFIIFDKRIVDDIEDVFEAEAEHIQRMAMAW